MATKIAPDFDYTDAELLALVKEAIAVVTKYGKSYVIGGRTFTRENISDLYDLLNELERRISRVATGIAYNLARRSRNP